MSGIFTIPPGGDFLSTLAEILWKNADRDPLKLSEALVLLPTRRACRHLQEAFLQLTPASLLPRMQPLGDIDEEEFYFTPTLDIDIPPAIAPLRRLMLLAQLVQKKDASLSFDQAALLAEALARFLDEAQTARCDMTKLHRLVEEKDLAKHWQETVAFLEILTEAWPKLLAVEGCIDPAQRRDLVLTKQAELWRAAPPNHPIIASGSTGTVPATADLLAVIASLPKGAVILPGLDADMSEEHWQELDETHPQAAMKHLLARLKVKRADVKVWGASKTDKTQNARIRLLQDAFHPGETEAKPASEKIHGLSRTALDHAQEEAQVIALMLREALETPNKNAALVTPDRALAARVAALLSRWKIDVNDSAGAPLLAQPPGGFLAALLAASAPDAEATDYLALLKHPLAACGLDVAECRSRARELELQLWRARVPEKSAWFGDIKRLLAPLASSWNAKLPLEARITSHIKIAEAFAKTNEEEGAVRLWAHEAGRATSQWLEEWRDAAHGFPPLSGGDYAALFQSLLRATPFRVPYGRHPRLSILGPLEARLLHYDLVILGGLNEGTWPADAGIDPWMSRPMRKDFGLPSPERRIGLSAHDFIQLASGPEAVLTRSRRSGTSLAVPSRFLLQLEAALRAQNYPETALDPAQPYALWARALDEPAEVVPCKPPEPKPPVNMRPKQLSVTEIGMLRRNPYAIYARRILKLEKLEPLEKDIDAADKGALIHEALEAFIKKFPGELPKNAEEELLKIGRGVFAKLDEYPETFAVWWPLFERIASWFIVYERARAAEGIKPVAAEAGGKIVLDDFTLKGRADRIDRLANGAYAITDYKTGGAPTNMEVKAGLEPQLPLLALIAKEGGFDKVPASNVAALSYLKLNGGRVVGKEQSIDADIAKLTEDARTGLMRLIEKFADPAQPYRAVPEPGLAPRYDDYAHLARLAEWGRTEQDKTGRDK
jgi:ATP-dependent helicase/nuclease subunit B